MDTTALEDLFGPLGAVMIKRMFGGHGVWADGLMFALQTGGEIFLKTDDETRPLFAKAGLRPFIYTARGEERATSYWLLHDAALDDDDELRSWTALAIEAARRSAAKKKPARAPTQLTRAKSVSATKPTPTAKSKSTSKFKPAAKREK